MLSPAAGARSGVPQHGSRRARIVAAHVAFEERAFAVKIDIIEGIGASHTAVLSRAGVTHVRHLLQRAATRDEREALAR